VARVTDLLPAPPLPVPTGRRLLPTARLTIPDALSRGSGRTGCGPGAKLASFPTRGRGRAPGSSNAGRAAAPTDPLADRARAGAGGMPSSLCPVGRAGRRGDPRRERTRQPPGAGPARHARRGRPGPTPSPRPDPVGAPTSASAAAARFAREALALGRPDDASNPRKRQNSPKSIEGRSRSMDRAR